MSGERRRKKKKKEKKKEEYAIIELSLKAKKCPYSVIFNLFLTIMFSRKRTFEQGWKCSRKQKSPNLTEKIAKNRQTPEKQLLCHFYVIIFSRFLKYLQNNFKTIFSKNFYNSFSLFKKTLIYLVQRPIFFCLCYEFSLAISFFGKKAK